MVHVLNRQLDVPLALLKRNYALHIIQSGATGICVSNTLSVKIDGNEAGNNLTSPEKFYALNPGIRTWLQGCLRACL